MEINKIKEICGPIPSNYEPTQPTSDNYVFEVDPSFTSINLFDFLGNGATVNSFEECAHYVNGGWEPFKTTIFDIGLVVLYVAIGLFGIYKIYKTGIYKYLKPSFLSEKVKKLFNSKNFLKELRNLIQKKWISRIIYSSYFLLQSYFLFDYIRTKSVRIPRFIDEYLTLTSNFNFFTNLNFTAGEFIGGNYTVNLTSGPISAIGSVIGWSVTNKLIIARLSNFLWIYLLQLIFAFILVKLYKKDFSFIFFITGLSIILVPWWQGSLYSLGELPSVIIFLNAIFLFPKLRKLSIILFSISIFYGKLLNLVPFAGFYLAVIFYERKIKYIVKDFILFLIPLSSWLLLANSRYEKGNAIQYLKDQYYFIINHQSSGAVTGNNGFLDEFINLLMASEFSSWNTIDKTRLLIVPVIFLSILFKNRENINQFFGNITIPLISSSVFIYLWFWVLNSTKWMRHTQHYMVVVIFVTIYLINFDIVKSKIDLAILISILALFIENNKYLILVLAVVSIFTIYNLNEKLLYKTIKVFLILIIFVDISLPYFEKDTFGNLHHIIEDCKVELISEECKSAYLNEN